MHLGPSALGYHVSPPASRPAGKLWGWGPAQVRGPVLLGEGREIDVRVGVW
jgi:hypothetical protein